MKWYEGEIVEAIALSKGRKSIFVVYIEGDDDKSHNLTSLINEPEISSKLESSTFVAIRVQAGSIHHRYFEAIYKHTPVPSLNFIGKKGVAIDVIIDSENVEDLSSRINKIIETHSDTSVSTNDSQQTSIATKSEENAENSSATASATIDENESHIDIDEKIEKSDENHINTNLEQQASTSIDVSATNTKTKEELIEEAKELIKIKQEAKKKEEEEAEKLKEIERRKMGQDVQKLRRWQQDQELKNLMEERQRAKNEDKAARERIRAQIAQDKADRAAKFGTVPSSSAQPVAEASKPPSQSVSNSNLARLQFRLPDGSSKTQDFAISTTLQEVRNFVIKNIKLPFRNFTLATSFPRREFSSEHMDQTLCNLELCPNAVILVIPTNSSSAVTASESGGFVSLIWLLLSPILGIFGYFRYVLFGDPTPAPTPANNKRIIVENNDNNSQAAKRRVTDSTVVRRQGNSNIHRLSDRTDSDEDNNTWNGNSTQQM